MADRTRDVANEELKRLEQGEAKDSTSTNLRYAAYGSRIRTAMMAASRYTAYMSDVGESFRPVAHPRIVRAAYGVSWTYIVGDVVYESYRCRKRHPVPIGLGDDYRFVFVKRAAFQTVASMALPALTIHSIVKYSGRAMKNVQNMTLRRWGPIGLGLGAVPALPYLFDEPVERAVDALAERIEEVWSRQD